METYLHHPFLAIPFLCGRELCDILCLLEVSTWCNQNLFSVATWNLRSFHWFKFPAELSFYFTRDMLCFLSWALSFLSQALCFPVSLCLSYGNHSIFLVSLFKFTIVLLCLLKNGEFGWVFRFKHGMSHNLKVHVEFA